MYHEWFCGPSAFLRHEPVVGDDTSCVDLERIAGGEGLSAVEQVDRRVVVAEVDRCVDQISALTVGVGEAPALAGEFAAVRELGG